MPQWDRDRSDGTYPDDRLRAVCPADAVALLRRFDHHTVWLQGRRALLLTYRWDSRDHGAPEAARPFEVSFTYAVGHPSAPPEVQAIVDRLAFTPITHRDPAS